VTSRFFARLEVNDVTAKSDPTHAHDGDREMPRRRGELIDDQRDKKPEHDEIPDTTPTEPEPVPGKEPHPTKQGPFIAGWS
jgi:hypothetical protein